MKNKKIFFIANSESVHTVKWVDYFVEQEYNVFLATFSSINNTKCKNIYFLSEKKTSQKGKNYHYLFSIKKLSKIFKEINPDVINAHYSYSMGLIAFLAKKKAKINAISSLVCHGSDILSPPMPLFFNLINRYLLCKYNKIFAVSDQIKDKIEYLGINIDKIFTGQYGMDLKVEANSEKDIDILSNRAYHPNSRIDFLLESLNSLNRSNLNIVFVLPNISDDDFNRIFLKYPNITFYKKINYKDMMNLMNRAKIYISATKSDGTALSLLEAMKYKSIPLISNIVSNRSWIVDNLNGYLFNSKKDFIKKLNIVLDMEKQEKQNIQISNIKLLEKKCEYSIQMKKIENFLMGDL